ncbi:MAG: DeoR family transcriptional regulator [Actinomycetota bacterium]|nr:MAG: DeoR family transcriptional regulator [Actinomycetota bacterium]
MHQAERLGIILEELSARGSVTVSELSDRLGVSAATVRRDLEHLEEQRLLTRTHGGAVAQMVSYELPLRYRSARRQEQKRRIGQEAARRAHDGVAIGLTGGTTTTEVARAIVDRRLTVVTNALNIASELAIRPNIKLVVTGGVARPESYELVGPLADRTLADLHLDVTFIGADGITAEAGLTTHHEIEAHTDRALMERARHVVAVADGSKLGKVAFARICPITAVHELVTDAEADPAELRAIADAGVRVTVV